MKLPAAYDKLSPDEKSSIAKEYTIAQEGLCCHCGEFLDDPPRGDVQEKPVNAKLFPPDFFVWPVHLHHNHETGMTIGVVHAYCNAVLWQFHGK